MFDFDRKPYITISGEEIRKIMEEEPKTVCNHCLRKSWSGGEKMCNMPQPDGTVCPGFMLPWGGAKL